MSEQNQNQEKEQKKRVSFLTTFKYFWLDVKPYKWNVFVTFFVAAFGMLLASAITPIIYQKIIDAITKTSVPEFNLEIRHWLILLVAALFVRYVLWRVVDYLLIYAKTKITKGLADRAFVMITRHSKNFFNNNFSGSLVAKHSRYTNSFTAIYEITIFSFWATAVSLAGILFVLFRQNKTLGFLFLSWVVVFVIISVFFAKYKIPFDERRAAANSRTTATLSDVITNILNVKIFSYFNREKEDYFKRTDEEEKLRRKAGNISNFQNIFQAVMTFALEVLGLYIAINLWSKGAVSVGFVVLVQAYVTQLFMLTWNIGNAIRNIETSLTDATEMVEIFETPIDVKDPEKPEKCRIKEGSINFENISFEYKDGDDVFQNFNLEIPAGQKVGLVGHSGSGKTTITNLLLRFDDVQGGAIKIDGQDIRAIKQDDLRKNISYVPQDPTLFHRSLEENISYAKPGASKKDVIAAAEKAHAHEFISEFKEGYDTLVGERGVKLSGGQRQRIAIARVMLKDAPILILDEATSSLDSISENLIQEAFDEAMKGHTTIVIAHRLSTIQKMDRIVVLEKGHIVEDGTHDELLAKKGYYFDLWQAQKGGMI